MSVIDKNANKPWKRYQHKNRVKFHELRDALQLPACTTYLHILETAISRLRFLQAKLAELFASKWVNGVLLDEEAEEEEKEKVM